jgi:four helix bundle protein
MRYAGSVLWEKSMRLAECTLVLSRRLPPEERFGMRSQIVRAATSVPSNVAEGWVRESSKEKVNFMSIAHGSLAEVHTQLLICLRARWVSPDDLAEALALIDEIGRMLTVVKRKWRQAPPDRVRRVSRHAAVTTTTSELRTPDYERA